MTEPKDQEGRKALALTDPNVTRRQAMDDILSLHRQLSEKWKVYEEKVDDQKKEMGKVELRLKDLDVQLSKKREEAAKTMATAKKYRELTQKVKKSREQINLIDCRTFAEIKNLPRPPIPLQHVIIGIMLLLGLNTDPKKKLRKIDDTTGLKKREIRRLEKDRKRQIDLAWAVCKTFLTQDQTIKNKMISMRADDLEAANVRRTRAFVEQHKDSFEPKRIRRASRMAEPIARIVLDMISLHGLLAGYGDIEKMIQKSQDFREEIEELEMERAQVSARLAHIAALDPDKEDKGVFNPFLTSLKGVLEAETQALREVDKLISSVSATNKQRFE